MTVEIVTKSGPGSATVKPVAPVAPAAAPVVTPEAAALKADREKFESNRRVAELKLNREAQKFKTERETEKKTWGEKLSQVERFEKLKANAKLNPEPYFRELLGDAYYEKMTEMRISGGAPAADVVAAKVAEIEEKVENRFRAADEERKKQEAAQQEESARRSASEMQQQVVNAVSEFWSANAGEFPAIAGEGHSAAKIASMIASEVRRQFDASSEVDQETGEILKEGVAPSLKAVAEQWETGLVSRAKRVASLPRYSSHAAKEAPSSVGQQQRRTLTNDLTASTPGRQTPAATEAERRERALAARLKFIADKSQS